MLVGIAGAQGQTNLGQSLQLYAGLTITGQVGTVCAIQTVTNLAETNNWVTLTNITLLTSPHVWLDMNGPAAGRRFYRSVTVPEVVPNMVMVPAGTFTMGDNLGDELFVTREIPLHPVTLSAFHMDRYEVTKAQWEAVYTWAITNGYGFDHSGSGQATNHPVHTVNWYDCVKWCNARAQQAGLTPAYYTDAALTTVYKTNQVIPYVSWNSGYRLPTEAEWEYAARGGLAGKRFAWGDTISHTQANYYSTTNWSYDVSATRDYHPDFQTGGMPYTSPAGSFAANGYGLYDLVGNVQEWCWDHESYSSEAQTDPRPPAAATDRVMRGGSWYSVALECRAASRNTQGGRPPYFGVNEIGFRAVRAPGQ